MQREFFELSPSLGLDRSRTLDITEPASLAQETAGDPSEPSRQTLSIEELLRWAERSSKHTSDYLDLRNAIKRALQDEGLPDRSRLLLRNLDESIEDSQTSTRYISKNLLEILDMAKLFTEGPLSDGSVLLDPQSSTADKMSALEQVVECLGSCAERVQSRHTRPVNAFPDLAHQLRSQFDQAKLMQQRKGKTKQDLPKAVDLSPFRYKKLTSPTSLRLLHFDHASEDPNMMRISLHTTDLKEAPSFSALSYVWSDHRPKLFQSLEPSRGQRLFPIKCNGHSLHVTYNLFQALRRLRSDGLPTTTEHIWIDQICINQNDSLERSAQITIMGDIYKSAETVIAWLGDEDRYTEDAVGLLHTLAEIPVEQYSDPAFDVSSLVGIIANESWYALSALLSRPYFTRAWVVQEVALAEKLIFTCGAKQITWREMVRLSKFFTSTKPWTLLRTYAGRFASLEEHFRVEGRRTYSRFGSRLAALAEAKEMTWTPGYSWPRLLMMGRHFEASDPRDKFYAMLGLVKERLDPRHWTILLPIIDYSKSIESVTLAFSQLYLRVTGDLQLLSLVEDGAHRINKNLPSWVPDYEAPLLPVPLELNPLFGSHQILPESRKTAFTLDSTGRILLVFGFLIDNVTTTAAPFYEIWENHQWVSVLNLLKAIAAVDTTYINFDEAFWQTLTTSTETADSKTPVNSDLRTYFGDWMVKNLLSIRKAAVDKILWAEGMSDLTTISTVEMDDLVAGRYTFEQEVASLGGHSGEPSPQLLTMLMNRPTTRIGKHAIQKMNADIERKEEFRRKFDETRQIMLDLWKLNPVGAFPDPERVRHTLSVLDDWKPDSPERTVIEENIDKFQSAVGEKLHSRRMFLTQGNHLGLGPQSLQEGDSVWVVSGLETPVVLRATEDGYYHMIGQAFLHVVNTGERIGAEDPPFEEIRLV